jgi:hypothetical protein
MNSQEIIFKFKGKENGVLRKIKESYMPLVEIKEKENEFGIFMHPILGILYIEQREVLIIRKTFFPSPNKEDFYNLGKFAKELTKLGAQYNVVLSTDKTEKLLFSHVMQEQFY